MSSIETPIEWGRLSFREKQHGIHPSALPTFKFDDNPLFETPVGWFFSGCRLGSSDSEFRFNASLLQSNPTYTLPIQRILARCLLSPLPEEKPLDSDVLDLFGLPAQDHPKLVQAYDGLVKENRCFLMHPARRSELLEYLGETFLDAELIADRLITYRCYGRTSLLIADLTAEMNIFRSPLIIEKLLDATAEFYFAGSLIGRSPEDFPPGKFSFLQPSNFKIALTHAFSSVTKLDIWAFFDKDLSSIEWEEPPMAELNRELVSKGHSQENIIRVIPWITDIRLKGWNAVVQKSLAASLSKLGGVNGGWRV